MTFRTVAHAGDPHGGLPHDLCRPIAKLLRECRFRNCQTRSPLAGYMSRQAKCSSSTKSWTRTRLMEENKAGGKIVVLT